MSDIDKTTQLIHFSRCSITFLVMSSVAGLIAIIMLVGGFDAIYAAVLHHLYQITEGTEAYDIWESLPVPIYMLVYYFNLTNPDEFVKGAKPRLQEIGPYAYQEYHQKVNLTFNSNGTVTFQQKRCWIWNQALSGDNSEDDEVILINPIPVTIADLFNGYPRIMTIVNYILNKLGEEFILKKRAGDIMFDGFEDPVLNYLQEEVFAENGSLHFLDDTFDIPDWIEYYDKFAWFYKRNNSAPYDGIFNMYTGENGLNDVGLIYNWNYSNATGKYDSPCDAVSGSAGEMWPPGLQKTQVELFSPDLCMSLRLQYLEEVEDRNGFEGYRYWADENVFHNQTYSGEICSYTVNGEGAPLGLLNTKGCKMGTPTFVSLPHFYNTEDPTLLSSVVGLQPDEAKHSFFIDFIPELSVAMNVAARLQVNMQIKSYPGQIDMLESVPDVILPLFWFEDLALLTDDLADYLDIPVYLVQSNIVVIIFGTQLGLSIAVIIGIITAELCRTKR